MCSKERAVSTGGRIRADRIVAIDGKLKSVRGARHPLAGIALREVVVTTDEGRTIRLITNDLNAPAADIGALYKARWQIELFFRWIKQHLKIKRFLGTSENAIRIQIIVALVVFLILQRSSDQNERELAHVCHLVRANLMHLRPLIGLEKPPPESTRNGRQQELALC